jgi:hypothetical protein
MEKKNWLFGKTNIRWGVKELIKMYSNIPSFFSHKRFQAGMAFMIYQHGSIYALVHIVKTMEDFAIWAAPELLICGYVINAIEKSKKDGTNGQV